MNCQQALSRAAGLALLASASALSPAWAASHQGGHGAHGDSGKPTAQAATDEMTDAEVRKVDKEGGKLTLRHGNIKCLDMPPMTMNIENLPVTLALATVSLCGGALAASHIVDIAWAADSRFAHKAAIAAGKFVEACGTLSAGERVRWSFTAGAPVDFNIHYHVGKEAVFPVKQTQVSNGGDTLNVTVAQDYCWMWTNKGSTPVSLTVQLAR